MPNDMEEGHSSMGIPQSPHYTSTESSRRSSLRAYYSEKDPESVSSPPQMRLTRKRVASLNVESANQPNIGDPALEGAGTNDPSTSTGPIRELVCLCQPDPKIPRPRNAFILYRQHMQSHVVAAHPGLSNPEISKIIGEQWKNQTPEVKTSWKQLAEEEKQRHSRQYPGYRYQPRRAGKTNGIYPSSAIAEGGPTHCPKCNGRYISTPSTPLTPYTPGFGIQGPRPEGFPHFVQSPMAEPERTRHPSQMQPMRMDSPRIAMPPRDMQGRRMQCPSQPMPTHHERDDEIETLGSTPEQKRRRYNDGPRYSVSSPTQYSQQQPQFGRPGGGGGSPLSAGGYRQPHQPSLPAPGNIMPRSGILSSRMGSSAHTTRHPYPTRSSASNPFDESLRLPPLQTQMTMPSSASSSRVRSLDHSKTLVRESQARSLEAMVMTIPYTNKINVLHRISPPLAVPGPTSPAYETRGAVIAIECFDRDLLFEVGRFVEETLKADSSFAVKSWDITAEPSKTSNNDNGDNRADVEMLEERNAPSLPNAKEIDKGKRKAAASYPHPPAIIPEAQNPYIEYLSIMSNTHRHSLEMIKHITTTPSPTLHQGPTSKSKTIPIAIIPNGYSLTTSNQFALRIPINDAYSPLDHWQWFATLWRGIVGPDLTVYVVRVGKEELAKVGGVEVRGDMKGIFVRVLEGGDGSADGAGVDEKTRRRLGFEVLEFVRGGGR